MLGGELVGYRKLVVGRKTWRIVYRVVDEGRTVEICEIWAVGLRSDREVYEEAAARVRAAARERPVLLTFADVVTRLGRLAGGVEPPDHPRREPLPDWLAKRLVHTAGLPPERVAALDAEQALDAWTDFITRGGAMLSRPDPARRGAPGGVRWPKYAAVGPRRV